MTKPNEDPRLHALRNGLAQVEGELAAQQQQLDALEVQRKALVAERDESSKRRSEIVGSIKRVELEAIAANPLPAGLLSLLKKAAEPYGTGVKTDHDAKPGSLYAKARTLVELGLIKRCVPRYSLRMSDHPDRYYATEAGVARLAQELARGGKGKP